LLELAANLERRRQSLRVVVAENAPIRKVLRKKWVSAIAQDHGKTRRLAVVPEQRWGPLFAPH
jgi:hypothetical protein